MFVERPLTLYACSTALTEKVTIMLEECEMLYILRPVDTNIGEDQDPSFLRINPTGRLPAMTCYDCEDCCDGPMNVFGSGAIILSLAEMTGLFQPSDLKARCACLQWFCWQGAEFGPTLRQAMDLRRAEPELRGAAIAHFAQEASRLYAIMDRRLSHQQYMAGEEYSIADIATFPWVRRASRQGVDLDAFVNVRRWAGEIAARPAVQAGIGALQKIQRTDDADIMRPRKQA